jgi:hypothetical protein
MRQELSPTGRLHLVLRDPRTRTVVIERWVPNLVTTAGRTLLADLLTGTVQGIAHIKLAVGSGSNPAAPADTELNQELRRVDTEFEATHVTEGDPPRSVTAVSAVLDAELGGQALELREAGLVMTLLAPGEGQPESEILYNRVVFPIITKEPELQMTLTWEVIF